MCKLDVVIVQFKVLAHFLLTLTLSQCCSSLWTWVLLHIVCIITAPILASLCQDLHAVDIQRYVLLHCAALAAQHWETCQGCAGKCLTTGSPGEIKSSFVAFASFPGVNPPTMNDFRLLKWLHWAQSWEKMSIYGSCQPAAHSRLTIPGGWEL